MRASFKARVYIDTPLNNNVENFLLPKNLSHYLLHVMRIKKGDDIIVFNGRDGEWLCCIDSIKDICCLRVKRQILKQPSSLSTLCLCFAPLKRASLGILIQKATELGVSALLPVLTDRVVVRSIRIEKLRLQAIEAAEQCERLTIPDFSRPSTLEDILHEVSQEGDHLFFMDEGGSGASVFDVFSQYRGENSVMRIFILIGPEGGFSSRERDVLQAHPKCISVNLGPRILRAESAAIAALSCWQAIVGDWDKSPARRFY